MTRVKNCIALAIILGLGSGCASYCKRKQMEAVARDWCLVVRASQVMPVYPLTEDVEPGDVFLVTTPIGKEASLYARRAFLPLDQHLTRLPTLDFRTFYDAAYHIGTNGNPPHHWQFPAKLANSGENGAADGPAPAPAEARHRAATDWASAPRAAFPTYAFSVKSGGGLKLAVPVQGVPIGLSFLKSGAASGTITISDAYVYGVSHDQLSAQLQAWAELPSRKSWLAQVRQGAGQPVYLRVVNRVYLTGSVSVALQHQDSMGATASGGQAKEVELLAKGDEGAATNYAKILDLINRKVDDALPGGTVKFVQVSERSVTMNETFDRPLVIGFLAFDFPVLKDGSLGAPVATQERLRQKAEPEVVLGELTQEQLYYRMLVEAVNANKAADTIYDTASGAVGAGFQAEYSRQVEQGKRRTIAFAETRKAWLRENRGTRADDVYRALFSAWNNSTGEQP